MSSPASTRFNALWLTETIALREQHAGPLDDDQANRQALVAGGDFSTRLINRAAHLAARDGQAQALTRWHAGARLAVMLLGFLALLSGAGLALAALGDGSRPVNVFWALGSLLGLNLLLLVLWLLPSGRGGALGQLWLWLSEKLARDAAGAHLAPALALMLQRARLSRWLLGLLSHGLWSLALCSALVSLLALLATRRYGFVWETTILSSDTFIALTQALGALPAALGFAVPDAALIRASGDGALAMEAARTAWASWLIGVVLVYGLLPRLLLLALCAWRWRRGRGALQLDLSDPAFDQLRPRLMPDSERLGVCDIAPEALHQPEAGSLEHGSGAVIVGLELDGAQNWPPALLNQVRDAGILDSREQRRQLLDQLARFPAERLLIVCDPRRSPDRGSLGLIADLSRSAKATRIYLLPNAALDAARVQDWHANLEQLALPHSDTLPQHWLEHGDD